MDLRITITDENSDIREQVTIYQDGSDSEGAARIVAWIAAHFTMDTGDKRT